MLVSVTRTGFISGPLTYILTPLSLEQAADLYGYIVRGEDSAEPGRSRGQPPSVERLELDMYVRHRVLLLYLINTAVQSPFSIILLAILNVQGCLARHEQACMGGSGSGLCHAKSLYTTTTTTPYICSPH